MDIDNATGRPIRGRRRRRNLGAGATGSWGDAPVYDPYGGDWSGLTPPGATVDFFGNISLPNGTTIDNQGNVISPTGKIDPAIAHLPGVQETITAAGDIGASAANLLGNLSTLGKWVVVGIVGIAIFEAMQFLPRKRS